MEELHDALGGAQAVWVGHDWGSAAVWSMASHHAKRCGGNLNLCIPYLARGLALTNLVPLVDRDLFPPIGFQWASGTIGCSTASTSSGPARTSRPRSGTPARSFIARLPNFPRGRPSSASIRANGGWFGPGRPPPSPARPPGPAGRGGFRRSGAGVSEDRAWRCKRLVPQRRGEPGLCRPEAPNFGRPG